MTCTGTIGQNPDLDTVADIICQRAEQAHASLIVLSKHNKGAMKELFTGSVTAKVIKRSKVPLLIFHEENKKA